MSPSNDIGNLNAPFPPQPDPDAGFRNKVKWIFAGGAIVLWCIALFIPAFSDGTPGVICAIFGWATLFDGNTLGFLAWFGNIPWLVALVMLIAGKNQATFNRAGLLAGLAVLLSFGAFTVTRISTNEGGVTHEVHTASATIVWMLSEIIALCGCFICASRGFRQR